MSAVFTLPHTEPKKSWAGGPLPVNGPPITCASGTETPAVSADSRSTPWHTNKSIGWALRATVLLAIVLAGFTFVLLGLVPVLLVGLVLLLPAFLPILAVALLFLFANEAEPNRNNAKTGSCPTAQLLVELVKDDQVRWQALSALARIGPEARTAVPAIIEALQKDRAKVLPMAARALGCIGPEAKTAVPALLDALDEEGGACVPSAIRQIGPAAVPFLIEGLAHKDGYTRATVAEILGQFGPKAKAAVPALREMLKDKEDRVRQAAQRALQQIDGNGP